MARKSRTSRGSTTRPSSTPEVPKPIRSVTGVHAPTPSRPGRRTPNIVLRGDWLDEAGFPVGAKILIRVTTSGQIAIDRISYRTAADLASGRKVVLA